MDDVFFGTKPNKKGSKPINLDELQLKKRAVELDNEDEEKVGKPLRLIDIALEENEQEKAPRWAQGWKKIDDLGLTIMPKKAK